MEVVPLHIHEEFKEACAEILNEEWPRSMAARIHGLNQSCDTLPVCLAFLKRDSADTKVLGFSKLSAVQGISHAGLAESVIVRKADRGKGLGRKLMDLTEEFAKSHGIQTMYLSTLDKEGFYSRLGYTRCQPVLSLGANAHRVPEAMLRQFMGTSLESKAESSPATEGTLEVNFNENHTTNKAEASIDLLQHTSPQQNVPSAPPLLSPPPPPSVPPPPPLPSVPPPPPLQSSVKSNSNNPVSRTNARMIVRMNPNAVTWMKKTL